MESINKEFTFSINYVKAFVKWIVISVIIGVLGGFLGSMFHICIDYVTALRGEYSMILSLEVFGAEGFVFFALAVSISYMMSGSFGLYKSQKIVYSKIDDDYINMGTK